MVWLVVLEQYDKCSHPLHTVLLPTAHSLCYSSKPYARVSPIHFCLLGFHSRVPANLSLSRSPYPAPIVQQIRECTYFGK